MASATFGWEKRGDRAGETIQPAPLRNGLLSSSIQLMTSELSGLFLMGGGTFDHIRNIPRLEILGSATLWNALHLNLKYSVEDFHWRSGTLQASLSLDLDQARVNASSTYSSGQLLGTSMIDGSLLVSSAGVDAVRNNSVGQSAVFVLAFHDLNGNGVRDAEEESLGNPRAIMRGGGSEMNGKMPGKFYNIAADMEYEIEVDKWSFAGNGLFPRRCRYTLYTLPSTVHVIQVPFSEGFDVSGNCRMASSGSAGRSLTSSIFNGLRISLVSPSGDAMYDGEIFSDGSILISGVSSGEYRVEFDQRQLESRGLEAEPLAGSVMLNAESTLLPEIVFRSRNSSPR
jgi:hypothetical protein